MKAEIDSWKRNNGNSSFTQKDMLIYLITRVDAMADKFVSKTTFWKVVGMLIGLIVAGGLTINFVM